MMATIRLKTRLIKKKTHTIFVFLNYKLLVYTPGMEIILTGSIAIDRIMSFKGRFKDLIKADKLHVLSIGILLDQLKDTPGGIAANISYSLALLGEKPVLLGSVGPEAQGYILKLGKMGIQTDKVHYSSLPTASFTVMTDRDDCQVGGFYAGAMSDSSSLTFQQFGDDSFIVISSHDPSQMALQVKECATRGLRMFYDASQQVTNISGADIRSGVEAAELLIANDYELAVISEKTGWSIDQIKNKVKVCVMTLGSQGCQIFQGSDKTISVKAAKISQVADPTGAGDAFRAGFLYGYVRNWSLTHCARLGSVVAAYAIEHVGTQEHHFTPAEVLQRYQFNYGTNDVPKL